MPKRAAAPQVEAHKNASNRLAKPDLPWRVEMVRTRSLRPPDRRARTHPKAQIAAIANSMRKFGVMTVIVADNQGIIQAGVARWEAGLALGLKYLPVIRASHL